MIPASPGYIFIQSTYTEVLDAEFQPNLHAQITTFLQFEIENRNTRNPAI